MKTQFLPFLVFLILTLYSCEKEEPSFTQVSGQVFEYGTNQPIPFAKVRFEWWNPAVYGESRHLVDSVTADEYGRYSLSGDIPENEEYYVIAKAPKYFKTEQVEKLRPNIIRGHKQKVNLSLIPYAWVKLNINKTGNYNYISINPLPGTSRAYQAISDTNFTIGPVLGNKEIRFHVFKYLRTQRTLEQHNIKAIGGDTTEVSISF